MTWSDGCWSASIGRFRHSDHRTCSSILSATEVGDEAATGQVAGNLRARESSLVVQNSDQPAGASTEWEEIRVHRQKMRVGGVRRGTNP
jgi:hypothetical protein